MSKPVTAPDNVMALRLSGKLTTDDVQRYKTSLEQKLSHEHLGACIDLTGLSDISADAVVAGAKVDFEFLRHIKQFHRLAFVSDKEWPGVMIGLVQWMLPTLQTKLFAPDQHDEAMRWAAQRPESSAATRAAAAHALRLIPTSEETVLAFEIDGAITPDNVAAVIDDVNAFLARHDKVWMLARIRNLAGVDPNVFLQTGLVSMKLAALKKVGRYAIVGAPDWMNKVVEAINPIFADIEMKTFASQQEDEAWAWIGAAPAKPASA